MVSSYPKNDYIDLSDKGEEDKGEEKTSVLILTTTKQATLARHTLRANLIGG